MNQKMVFITTNTRKSSAKFEYIPCGKCSHCVYNCHEQREKMVLQFLLKNPKCWVMKGSSEQAFPVMK